MRIAYVDDEASERSLALPIFENGFRQHHLCVRQLDTFSDGASFFAAWDRYAYDLVILDIYMGEISGVEVANRIRERNKDTRIVFCSTSNEFANESYDVNACYYIQKPVTEESVSRMITRLNIADLELRRSISLPDEQPLVLRNMIYSHYHNHRVEIITKKGPNITVWMSQSDLVNLLSSYSYFLSCNSGSIINLWEVSEMKSDCFVMSDGTCIPVSRRKKRGITSAYHTFLLNSVKEGV